MSPQKIQIVLISVLGFLLVACQQDGSEEFDGRQDYYEKRAVALEKFQPCPRNATTAQARLVSQSRCMHFSVPENYADPEGRQIDLKIMLIPSLSDLPEPDALFLLAGGPGQAATDLTHVAQVFSRVRTDRDIVLVDQRGTGELSPFECQLDEEEVKALEEQDPPIEEILAIQLQVLRDCLDIMEASPEYYTTDIAMRDLDNVRQYLGYPQLNLWGASYGSRAALAYLQAYPDNTRTVIIDAIAPPSLSLPLYNERDASASLARIFSDCAASSECSAAYPDLADHYQTVLARLETPQQVTVLNDTDFSTLEFSLESVELQNILRLILYSREAQRLIPLIIEQAFQGNYRPVFALANQYSETLINQGMFLSVICSEDYSLINDEMLAAESENEYLIRAGIFTNYVMQACEIWPKREVPESYFEPVTEDKPVLIFSGVLDPITPPTWGEQVDAALPQSAHFILEGFGHGTLFTLCTAGIMDQFIDIGTLAELDTDCLNQFRRRPFFVSPGGSSSSDD